MSLAQVTSDNTVNTQVTQDGNAAEITGGETRGGNLFHSFQDFSVPTGNEASFNNADTIENIFSRVTGGNISNIDGLIRANGGADLYLINPTGIIFGENARLDIGGSFLGSTSTSILFENGEFSAADLENPPLLTVNAPIGLGFREQPGDIINRSTADGMGLRVSTGQNISLVGGNINLEGGLITAPGGRVTLGGLSTAGAIALNKNINFSSPEAVERGDISLSDGAAVNVRADGGGDINITASSFEAEGGSRIFTGTRGQGDAGNINITTETLDLTEGSRIFASTFGEGNAGNIEINVSEQFTMRDESQIDSQLQPGAVGNAGNITIDVANQFLIEGGSTVTSAAEPRAVGNAGNIEINTGSQIITDSIVIADSEAQGGGGNINITAQENIILQSTPDGIGSRIVTGLNRSVNDETGVVESVGEGDAGNINLSANQISLNDKSFVISNIEGIATSGGEININADILRVENNSFVSTFTITESNAGSINVVGNKLTLESGGKLITSTDGDGNAGTIDLSIGDRIVIDNGKPPSVPKIKSDDPVLDELQNRTGLFVNATERAIGNGGNIIIQSKFALPTNSLRILNGAEVSADGGLRGNAGNISVLAKSIEINNNVSFIATTFSEDGGNINLIVDETITLNNNSLISAEANNTGNGGNITIDSQFIIAFADGNNDIIASAEQGSGGNIFIEAESIFGIKERSLNDATNDINASSEVDGLDGTIAIFTPNINPVRRATESPTDLVAPEQTVAQVCQTNRETVAKNGLNITGKGGIPPEPGLPLNSLNFTVTGETNPTSATSLPMKTSKGKIQPARGIKETESGKIILTAYRTNNAGDRLLEIKRNCS